MRGQKIKETLKGRSGKLTPVDKQKLIEYIESESGMNIPEWLRNTILSSPEITTCKECKHCDIDRDTGYAYCTAWQRGTQADWYCSRGEAR